MAYTVFNPTFPVGDTRTGIQLPGDVRLNLLALRDALAGGGAMIGWDFSKAGGTAEKPATITYAKGTERVRLTITWGTSGGALDNPITIVYAYSSDSGSNYDTMGTQSITYDASGNVDTITWS